MGKLFSNVKDFFGKASDNLSFLAVFIVVVVAVFLLAYLIEKLIQKKNNTGGKILTTRKIAMIGMFSAISGILMVFEFQVPFIAPSFYELDASEIPVLICGFAFGPVAGVVSEFLKVLVKLILKSTSTAFVGDLANFAVGCTFILPAVSIYHLKKSKKMALVGCIAGTLCMTIFGTAFNAIYLVPTFAKMFFSSNGMDIIISMGTKINSAVKDITSFVMICVAPLNLLKGVGISVVTLLIYKPLSPIIKYSHNERVQRKKTGGNA